LGPLTSKPMRMLPLIYGRPPIVPPIEKWVTVSPKSGVAPSLGPNVKATLGSSFPYCYQSSSHQASYVQQLVIRKHTLAINASTVQHAPVTEEVGVGVELPPIPQDGALSQPEVSLDSPEVATCNATSNSPLAPSTTQLGSLLVVMMI